MVICLIILKIRKKGQMIIIYNSLKNFSKIYSVKQNFKDSVSKINKLKLEDLM